MSISLTPCVSFIRTGGPKSRKLKIGVTMIWTPLTPIVRHDQSCRSTTVSLHIYGMKTLGEIFYYSFKVSGTWEWAPQAQKDVDAALRDKQSKRCSLMRLNPYQWDCRQQNPSKLLTLTQNMNHLKHACLVTRLRNEVEKIKKKMAVTIHE